MDLSSATGDKKWPIYMYIYICCILYLFQEQWSKFMNMRVPTCYWNTWLHIQPCMGASWGINWRQRVGLCNGIKLNIRWWRIPSETFPTRNSAHFWLLFCVLMQHSGWLLWVLLIVPLKSNWIQMQGLLSWLQRKLQWLCYALVNSLSWKNGEYHNRGKLHTLRFRSSQH